MAYDQGSNPAALHAHLVEPNTNPVLKKVAEHIIKIRNQSGLDRSFIELPYDKQRDFENLTTDGQKYIKEAKSTTESAVWGNYGNNPALLTPPEIKKVTFRLTLPRPRAAKLVEENTLKGSKIETSTHTQYARALRNFDGVRGYKYEWTPTDNKVEGSYFNTKAAFNDLKHPLSRSTIHGSKAEIKSLSRQHLYQLSPYVPGTALDTIKGETITTQCKSLGLDPLSLYDELTAKQRYKRGTVEDVFSLQQRSEYSEFEDYQEAIFQAQLATRTAIANCGYHLPAYIMHTHLRRLKRLAIAAKAHLQGGIMSSDSDTSLASNKEYRYEEHRPRQDASRNQPNPSRDQRRRSQPRQRDGSRSPQKAGPGRRTSEAHGNKRRRYDNRNNSETPFREEYRHSGNSRGLGRRR